MFGRPFGIESTLFLLSSTGVLPPFLLLPRDYNKIFSRQTVLVFGYFIIIDIIIKKSAILELKSTLQILHHRKILEENAISLHVYSPHNPSLTCDPAFSFHPP